MIILAAAIILSLQSSGIIGRANEAKAASDMANKKQAATVALAEYELEKQLGETTKTATEYVQDKLKSQKIDGSDVAVTEDGEILVGLKKSAISALEKGVKIGDYVDYTPTAATSTKYKVCEPSTSAEAEDAAYFATQTGENALKWRYMGIDDKGNAILVSELPTNDGLLLSGKDGYVNGPSKLNELCKTLYSNTSLGEARSINVEDVNRVLGANPVGKYYSTEGKAVENPEGLTIGKIAEKIGYNMEDFASETPEEGKDIKDYVSDFYSYAGSTYKALETLEHDLIFKKLEVVDGVTTRTNITYWLASSCVYAYFYNGHAGFYVRRVYSSSVNLYRVFHSDGTSRSIGYAVRPVVTLNSDIQFGTKSGAGVWSIS